ncbi:MAG: ATP-binding protein, partial [Pyramidobacter sp.]|nr:ATP-binding protein [Pyramidobacter sp.]
NVFIGRSRTQEVDFVAIAPSGDEVYYQVSWSVREEGTLRRELAALESVKNHSPKFLITMDNDPPVSYNGIRQVFALDWLLERSGQLASSLP